MAKAITVEVVINAPAAKVWKCWTEPKHITKWCFALDTWEAPHAENDVRVGGHFKTVMAAKDKSVSFDFGGTYTAVTLHKHIAYTIADGRKVSIHFENSNGKVKVTETFEMEQTNPEAKQRDGWQAILNNFKNYVEHQK